MGGWGGVGCSGVADGEEEEGGGGMRSSGVMIK